MSVGLALYDVSKCVWGSTLLLLLLVLWRQFIACVGMLKHGNQKNSLLDIEEFARHVASIYTTVYQKNNVNSVTITLCHHSALKHSCLRPMVVADGMDLCFFVLSLT